MAGTQEDARLMVELAMWGATMGIDEASRTIYSDDFDLRGLGVHVTVAKWFVARRGMAISLASLGVSLGGVVMAPVLSLFIDAFGWRPSWVMLGCTTWAIYERVGYLWAQLRGKA